MRNTKSHRQRSPQAVIVDDKKAKLLTLAGIVAEMIKVGRDRLQSVLADLFNDVLVNNTPPPQEWKMLESTWGF